LLPFRKFCPFIFSDQNIAADFAWKEKDRFSPNINLSSATHPIRSNLVRAGSILLAVKGAD